MRSCRQALDRLSAISSFSQQTASTSEQSITIMLIIISKGTNEGADLRNATLFDCALLPSLDTERETGEAKKQSFNPSANWLWQLPKADSDVIVFSNQTHTAVTWFCKKSITTSFIACSKQGVTF